MDVEDNLVAGRGNRSQQRVNNILSALGDAIRSSQEDEAHEPTPTEYFVVIFRTLSVSPEMSEYVTDLLTLLNALVPRVSRGILRDQFKGVTLLLSKIIQSTESSKLLRLCMEIIGGLLEVQDHSEGFWGGVQALKIVNMFLGLLDDERVKIRKTAHNVLFKLLREHRKTHSIALASYVGEFCIEVLKSCTRSEYKRSLAVVNFLETALPLLPSDTILQLIDVALRLPACNQPVLSAAMLKMMDSFYQSPALILNIPQLFECVRFLIAMPPETLDMEANAYYCTAIASGLLRLKDHTDNVALPELLVGACVCLVRACETDFTQIHCAIATALKRLVYGFVTDRLVAESVAASAQQHTTYLHRFLSGIEVLLQLRYQQSWIYILDAVRAVFEVIRGNSARVLCASFVAKLAEVNQAIETGLLTVETPIALAVSDTLGAMIKSLGVVNFLALVPFTLLTHPQTQTQSHESMTTLVDTSREWLLSIMHATLKTIPCSLGDFGSTILPLASQCNALILAPEKHGLNAVQVKQLRNRVLQLWSLLPDFVSFGCVDVATTFPKSADILLKSMKNASYPELLPIIVSALTHIGRNAVERATIAGATPSDTSNASTAPVAVKLIDTPDVVCLRTHARAFIPAILDFLETIDITDVRFNSCVTCISIWVSLAEPTLVTGITRKLLQLLLVSTSALSEQNNNSSSSSMNVEGATGGATNEENIAAGWMCVLRSIIPYLTPNLVELLFRTVRPLLSIDESLSVQKRAYHVLEGLLQTHGEVIYAKNESAMSLLGAISESLLTCHVSARNMRLRCIDTLVQTLGTEDIHTACTHLLGEILICQRDSNQKSRLAAITLLKTFIQRVSTSQMLMQLCSAIVGETTVMRASGIVGLCVLLLQKRGHPTDGQPLLQQMSGLLPTICILLREECAEQTRAILSFIRVCVASLPLEMLGSGNAENASVNLLPQIIHSICVEIGTTLKPKFASRIRAIFRKLIQRIGIDAVQPLVPEPDMQLIVYIQRQNRRHNRKQLAKERAHKDEVARMLGSDSESGSDDSENDDDIDKHKVSIVRPKAIRSKDIMGTSLPTTLDNLLDDQPASFMVASQQQATAGAGRKKYKAKRPAGSSGEGGANSTSQGAGKDDEDDDEEYRVVVAADGKICVQSTAAGGGVNSKQILSLAENMKQSLAQQRDQRHANDSDDEGHKSGRGKKDQQHKKQRVRDFGEDYRAKKGTGGDVWRKGQLAPHAFIPLDPKLLSKKNRTDAIARLGVVVGGSRNAGAGVGKAAKGKSKTRGFVVGNRNQRRSGKEHKSGN